MKESLNASLSTAADGHACLNTGRYFKFYYNYALSFSAYYLLLSSRNTLKIQFEHLAHLTCKEAWDLFALVIDCEQSDFNEIR